MRDLSRLQNDKQFWITRTQLGALGVTTLAVAALAFFVGVMVGQEDVPLPVPLKDEAMLSQQLEDDAITELLARVETAAASRIPEANARPIRQLSYAEELVADEEPIVLPEPIEVEEPIIDQEELDALAALDSDSIGEEPDFGEPEEFVDPVAAVLDPDPEPVVVEPEIEEEPEPPPSEEMPAMQDLPTEGWAIQVYSFPSAFEAEARVTDLEAKGFDAYRVAALVGGDTWHRVRLGPYDTQQLARKALPRISSELGVADPLVTRAP